MTHLKALLFTLVLIPCALYSQKLVSVNGEQLIGYTQQQNDYIFKSIKQRNLFRASDSICNAQMLNLQMAIRLKNERIGSDSLDKRDLRKAAQNSEEKFSLTEQRSVVLEKQISSLNKSVNRQKAYKWVAIIVGGAASVYLTYRYITK